MDMEVLRHILFSLRELEDYVYHAIKDEERSLFRSKFSVIPGGQFVSPGRIEKSDVLAISKKEKEIDEMIIDVPGVSVGSKPRPDGRFQGYITRDGVKFYVYGENQDQVRSKIKYLLANGLPKKRTAPKNSTSLLVWLEKWLDLYKKPNVKPTTFEDLKMSVRIIGKHFKDVKLADVKADDLQKFLTDYKGDRRRQSLFGILKQAFSKAVQTGALKQDPTVALEIKKHVYAHKNALTREEQRILSEKVKGTSIEDLFFFLISTGLRVGEALALSRSDIDIKRGTVSVTKDVVFISGKRIEQPTPKTSASVRSVPVPRGILEKLEKTRGILFPMTYNAVRLAFRRLQEETGIKISAHVLRHTYATRLEEAGISPKVKQYLLGHSSIAMTQNTYTDVQQEHLDTLKETITSIFT